MNEEFEMNKELKKIEEKVLKRETNKFLEELEILMTKSGVKEALEDNSKNRKGKGREKVPGRSQFKTLMDATEEASSLEELLLFISYQKSKKEGWERKCTNGKDIAENLVDSLMNVKNDVYSKIKENANEKKIEISNEEERIMKLIIAKKYMGYLYWKASAVSRY